MDKKGFAIIFHSGSYDRVYHGLSIGIAASALGREVKLFFTYWALEYLKKNKTNIFKLDKDVQARKRVLDKNIKKGHIVKLEELFKQTKQMGVKFYACTNSMGLLNISRDELIGIVDKSMGIITFLTEAAGGQMIFV